ncbi:MAG TPA: MarR family transcriptional regulator [Anaerolineae bacterium]|nr:MarR family transcriptional regulator [Anaerolineae bacterium]HNU05886.1 MarR family transcriptional regulator [Anaerolineae bacterium]
MGTHFQGDPDEIRALNTFIKLARATDAVTQRINRHLKAHGLTASQFGVLEALYHLGPLCQTELAGKILKSTGNLTLVIDNLEQAGLVERQRDTVDRRFVSVHLTTAGEALIGRIFQPHVLGVVETMSALSAQEQDELASLCRKLGLAQREA